MRRTPLQPSVLLLSGLQSSANRLLAYDSETLAALAQLEGKVIAIEITQPAWWLYLLPGSHGITLEALAPERVDVSIAGRPGALLGMVIGDQDAGSQGHVEIRGDIHLAQQVQRIMKAADVDWEELLSAYLGDMAAHHLGRIGREMGRSMNAAGRSFANQFVEYMRYEQTMLPPRREVERFIEAIDTLRDDVERARQRLARLEQQRGNQP